MVPKVPMLLRCSDSLSTTVSSSKNHLLKMRNNEMLIEILLIYFEHRTNNLPGMRMAQEVAMAAWTGAGWESGTIPVTRVSMVGG